MEQRNKILNQLQEGKITPEQALEQLETLKTQQKTECCKIIIQPSNHTNETSACCNPVIIKTNCCDAETACCEPSQKKIIMCCPIH